VKFKPFTLDESQHFLVKLFFAKTVVIVKVSMLQVHVLA